MGAIKKLDVGGFMTEFGASLDSQNGDKMIRYLMDLADKNFQSWAYWQFKYFQDLTTAGGDGESLWHTDGTLQTGKVAMLSRSYVRAMAGTPIHQKFDSTTNIYTLQYKTVSTKKDVTEIYVNSDIHYPKGYSVTVTGAGAQYQVSGNLIYITHSTAGVDVSVTVKPL